MIYSRQRYDSECVVAGVLASRVGRKSKYSTVSNDIMESCIADIQEELEVELDPLQRVAVERRSVIRL